jgi:3-hydroxyisobutyrate dehydrogenase-like beta-hydroxyacid dehydrogenase
MTHQGFPMTTTIGFIGTGVMGEPMCRNLAMKSGRAVTAFDQAAEPLQRLAKHGVSIAASPAGIARDCDLIFLVLPSGSHVEAVCDGDGGLCALARPGQTIVDCGTSPVSLARRLATTFAARGAAFADAPIARTRQAAESGTLSIMVGAELETFVALQPLLALMGSEITHCGKVGAGQLVKILNNMVLIETVVALAEALGIARANGLDGGVLFDTMAKGSADSFALRNHGMKAMLPGAYPEQAFSTAYALKDLDYAFELARDAGLSLDAAKVARVKLAAAIDAGFGANYWPVIARMIDQGA